MFAILVCLKIVVQNIMFPVFQRLFNGAILTRFSDASISLVSAFFLKTHQQISWDEINLYHQYIYICIYMYICIYIYIHIYIHMYTSWSTDGWSIYWMWDRGTPHHTSEGCSSSAADRRWWRSEMPISTGRRCWCFQVTRGQQWLRVLMVNG
jgi:hypothetical protein